MTDRALTALDFTPPPATVHAANRWLSLGRAAWLLLAVTLTFFHGRGLLILLSAPLNPCFDPNACNPAQAVAYLQQMGLDAGLVAALVFVAISMVVPFTCLAVASFIIGRGGNSPIALAAATVLLLYGLLIGSNVSSVGLGPLPFQATVNTLGLVIFVCALSYMLHAFPNGRLAPRWSAGLLAAEWVMLIGLSFTAGLESPASAVALLMITVVGVGLQVYRYRRVASPGERQQIKWGLTGLIGFLLNGVLWIAWVVPSSALGAAGLRVYLVFVPLSLVLVLSLPVTLAIAVLRYRLWDIDVLIRRTLIYSALTGVLTLTYLGLVIVLQAGAGALTGQRNSALVTVLSTLAIAALFAPVRRGVQNFVDRRFYRRKYDTSVTLATFAHQARNEVDLDELSAELRAAVTEAMQPAHVDLWLR